MKKPLTFLSKLCETVFYILLCLILITIALHIMLEAYTTIQSNRARAIYDEEYFKLDYCYVDNGSYADKFMPHELRDLTNDVLRLFPEIVSETIKSDWAFVFTRNLLDGINLRLEEAFESDASGITFADIKTIFILTPNEDQLKYVILHEICHAVGYEYGNVDYSVKFGKIYDTYKDSYKEPYDFAEKDYAASSQLEFFASALSVYINEPEELKEIAPSAYDFMADLLEVEIEGNIFKEMADSSLHFIRTIYFTANELIGNK